MKYITSARQAGKRLIVVSMFAITTLLAALQPAAAQVNKVTFKLYPNPKFSACLGEPGGPSPEATVTVTRGSLADTLNIPARTSFLTRDSTCLRFSAANCCRMANSTRNSPRSVRPGTRPTSSPMPTATSKARSRPSCWIKSSGSIRTQTSLLRRRSTLVSG